MTTPSALKTPLPFISAGSTPFLVFMSAIGVVLNVDRQSRKSIINFFLDKVYTICMQFVYTFVFLCYNKTWEKEYGITFNITKRIVF